MSQKSKKTALIIAAILLCGLTAVGAYSILRSLTPQDDNSTSNQPVDNREQPEKRGDELFAEGEKLLYEGKTDEAIEKFKESQEYYEQADNGMKVDQANDQIAVAKHLSQLPDEQRSPSPETNNTQEREEIESATTPPDGSGGEKAMREE